MKSKSPRELAASLTEHWSPRIIGEVNDSYVKVAKLLGQLVWHSHEREDELFLVVEGQLCIEFEDDRVELSAGEMYVVPKGKRHNPIAREECLVMLIEPKSTRHTGEVDHPGMRDLDAQLRPL